MHIYILEVLIKEDGCIQVKSFYPLFLTESYPILVQPLGSRECNISKKKNTCVIKKMYLINSICPDSILNMPVVL